MTFEIHIDGRTHSVSVDPIGNVAAGDFVVVRDGVSERMTVRQTDLGVSLVFADGRVLDAAATRTATGAWLVQMPHTTLTAEVGGRRRPTEVGVEAGTHGEQRITAPMPGRVVRILVRPGDDVAARQGLVVVEAMKMENELAARASGRVKEICVTEGASIEAGRVLVVIE